MDELDTDIPELKAWFEGAGGCGSHKKAQASARVDVPTAPSNRHHTASPATWPCSRLGAQEMLPNLLKDVDERTIFDLDEAGGGGAAAIRTEPTSRSRHGSMWRSRVSTGRRRDLGPPVPGSVIRMERGPWQGEPGLYMEGVQTESRRLRSVRTGSSCLISLRAWPRPS